MASMRRVTRKPPKILIDAMKMPAAARIVISMLLDPIWINAPKMMIDEIALVTAISGVCSECATFQITWNPMKTDSTKNNEMLHEAGGGHKPPRPATAPLPRSAM